MSALGNDTLTIGGDLDLGDSILQFIGTPELNVWHTIISAGNITGDLGSWDPAYSVQITDTAVMVMVPEATTTALIFGLMTLATVLVRRRSIAA